MDKERETLLAEIAERQARLAELDEPDPLLIEAREVAAKCNKDDNYPGLAFEITKGDHDEDIEVRIALAALRRGMELGKAQPSAKACAEIQALLKAGNQLCLMAETSDGAAGRDEGLVSAINGWVAAKTINKINRYEDDGTVVAAGVPAKAPPTGSVMGYAEIEAELKELALWWGETKSRDQPLPPIEPKAPPTGSVMTDAEIDSGMGGDLPERAEWLWASLPTTRKWTSLPTHEKAMVCHALSRVQPRWPSEGDKVELVNAIINAYHTTRIGDTPFAQHILSKAAVKDAFARAYQQGEQA